MMNWHWLVPVFSIAGVRALLMSLCVFGGAVAVLAAALCGSLLRK